jgi:hypothetical protein
VLLEGSVHIFAILDRDYRSPHAAAKVIADLDAVGIKGHVWERKELESYLLHPAAIARSSGATREVIDGELSKAVEHMKDAVYARLLDEKQRELVGPSKDRVDIIEDFQHEFKELWTDPVRRTALCPPKEIISWLNREIDKLGTRSISARKLSRSLRISEIPQEMIEVLQRIERAAT